MKVPDIIYTDGGNTCAPAPVFSNTDGNIKYIRADLTEQPEVDLEGEIRDYFSKWGYNIYNGAITMDNGIVVTLSSIQNVARHFWNKGYNARKK